MEIKRYTINGKIFAELISDKIILSSTNDFIDIIGECGTSYIIIHKENIAHEFFDLKTRIAGDILQKASTYNISLGIIGDFTEIESKALRDFIFESNRTKRQVFKGSLEEIIEAFAGN